MEIFLSPVECDQHTRAQLDAKALSGLEALPARYMVVHWRRGRLDCTTEHRMKRQARAITCGGFAVSLSITLALLTGAFAQEFPFERELLLDAAPMRGSKRVPGLEIGSSGQATIDLWCKSGPGQVIVAGDTITIMPGAMRAAQCGPEQTRGDDEILANLMQVTHWRREADVLILIGPTSLRFRSTTN